MKNTSCHRKITSHVVNEANDKLTITVEDEKGSGGAHHRYFINGFNTKTNPSALDGMYNTGAVILFQNGPINEAGVNGVTHEVLLAILIDRMECFQSGPYACDDNAEALSFLAAAQTMLQKRTTERMARGVEGTHEK